jgi:hypothetical protein
MLPRLPPIENLIDQMFNHLIEQVSHFGDPMFSEIDAHKIYEGRSSQITREDGVVEQVDLKKFSSEKKISDEDARTFGWNDFGNLAREIGLELLKHKKVMMYRLLDEATAKSGNVIKIGGKLTHEHFFEMLELIHIDFNPDGTPRMPTGFIPPSMAEAFKRLIAEPETEQQKARYESIMKKKREQFLEREANRKLVG